MDEITYPFQHNGCTFEVWEWMSNFIPYFTGHLVSHNINATSIVTSVHNIEIVTAKRGSGRDPITLHFVSDYITKTGPNLISDKTSYREISQSLEGIC